MAELGPYKRAVLEAEQRAGATRVEKDGVVLYEFPDYDSYRDVQTAGNKAKLKMQFVKEPHIELLSDYLKDKLGAVSFGICHGTRQGKEQAWFRKHLGADADVIGTEISDTADQFPHTVQWDFHDENPEWKDRCDFVYSNSWDHAFDPVKALSAWIASLRVGGLMVLDYTRGQSPEEANALDPFGITYDKFIDMLKAEFGDRGRLHAPIDCRENKKYRAMVVVFERTV